MGHAVSPNSNHLRSKDRCCGGRRRTEAESLPRRMVIKLFLNKGVPHVYKKDLRAGCTYSHSCYRESRRRLSSSTSESSALSTESGVFHQRRQELRTLPIRCAQ